jgi:hypothetical protein
MAFTGNHASQLVAGTRDQRSTTSSRADHLWQTRSSPPPRVGPERPRLPRGAGLAQKAVYRRQGGEV